MNSKHKSFGCKINNTNGNNLNEFLSNSSSIILNNKLEFTYYRECNNYKEILDLIISSSNLFHNVSEC